jgi:hypothetical protein
MRHDVPVPTRVEKYLSHLRRLRDGGEPVVHRIASTTALQPVGVMQYSSQATGLTTYFTYGLSYADHPQWRHGKPELVLSVRSVDPRWGSALGHIAEGLRGSCPFSYGNTIRFGQRIVNESTMRAFVVFAPAMVERDDWLVDVSPDGQPGRDIVHLTGMYPIHEVEAQFIDANGLEAFWHRDWDPYDVRRRPAV